MTASVLLAELMLPAPKLVISLLFRLAPPLSVAAPVTAKNPPTVVLPVDSKVALLIAPDAVALFKIISSSKSTVNMSPDTDVLIFLPPATANVSPSFLAVLPVSPVKVMGLLPKLLTVVCNAVIS